VSSEGKRDVKERRPALIHREFRGVPAFKSHKTFPLHVRASRWLRWLGSLIFNDPQVVSFAWHKSAYEIDVPEPGVPAILCA
jgi:hypothetical protein